MTQSRLHGFDGFAHVPEQVMCLSFTLKGGQSFNEGQDDREGSLPVPSDEHHMMFSSPGQLVAQGGGWLGWREPRGTRDR